MHRGPRSCSRLLAEVGLEVLELEASEPVHDEAEVVAENQEGVLYQMDPSWNVACQLKQQRTYFYTRQGTVYAGQTPFLYFNVQNILGNTEPLLTAVQLGTILGHLQQDLICCSNGQQWHTNDENFQNQHPMSGVTPIHDQI